MIAHQAAATQVVSCPALLIAAPASGQGKTTITAALSRYYSRQGLDVRVFKVGPDFLDPMLLQVASGHLVYQLDLWMGDEAHCRQLLQTAAKQADLILIEGVMGLFDGEASSAELAVLFGIPVLAVINAAAMAQTFGAVALGLATYQSGLPFAGVLANGVASDGHFHMLNESLPASISALAWLQQDAAIALPERHLGLVQAHEMDDVLQRIDQAANRLHILSHALPEPVDFMVAPTTQLPPLLAGRRIAIAKDAAFSFLYAANLDVLVALGAELVFVSPLHDASLPEVDALYLPGGYPELYAQALAANVGFVASLHDFYAASKPIFAECGGMLYLLTSLTDHQGQRWPMAGLLPGHGLMHNKLVNLGRHQVDLPEGNLRGHSFHYATIDIPLTPITWSKGARAFQQGEAIYREQSLFASFMHIYFPSNPATVAALFAPNLSKE